MKKLILCLLLLPFLLPLDRALSLHVVFISWLILCLLPVDRALTLVILLGSSLLHDIGYLYPLGLTGALLSTTLLVFNQFGKQYWWKKAVLVFLLCQIFVLVDYGSWSISFLTLTQAGVAGGVFWIVKKLESFNV